MIERITDPGSVWTTQADYQAQNENIRVKFLDTHAHGFRTTGNNIDKGNIFNIGGAIYLATSSEAITGTPSDYVRITADGSEATAEYVSTWSGVTWNDTFNGFYDGTGRLYFCLYHYGARVFEHVGPWTGTFVPPKGVDKIILTMCGAGGDGGFVASGSGAAGGGGSGAWCLDEVVDVNDGAEYSIVLSDSTDSTAFGSTFGKGSNGSTSSSSVAAGGNGGIGTGIAKNGSKGGDGRVVSGEQGSGGGAGFMPGGSVPSIGGQSGSGGSFIEGSSNGPKAMAYRGRCGKGAAGVDFALGDDADPTSFMAGGGGGLLKLSGGVTGGDGGYGGGGGGHAVDTIRPATGQGGPAYIRITW